MVKCSSTVLEVMGSESHWGKQFSIYKNTRTLYYYNSAPIHVVSRPSKTRYMVYINNTLLTTDIFIFGPTARNVARPLLCNISEMLRDHCYKISEMLAVTFQNTVAKISPAMLHGSRHSNVLVTFRGHSVQCFKCCSAT